MKGADLNKVLGINAKHALYRDDGKWFHHLKEFPGALFDRNGYIIFYSKSEYDKHTALQHGIDLHVKDGISTLKDYISFSNEQKRKIVFDLNYEVTEDSIRQLREVQLIVRNPRLVKKLKEIYSNACQICGVKLKIKKGRYYSEVHHIKPLGSPHNGPDKIENMICVCPNDHVLLDLGSKD